MAASRLIDVIRNAVRADQIVSDDEAETGASAPSNQEKTDMSVEQKPAPAGISQADHEAAVTAAEGRGREQGAAQANARLSAALGAEGVRSDAGRMSAALDLALKAPAMSGEDVAGFVISSVPAAAKSEPAPEAYEQERLRAVGQAKPAQKTATQGGEDVAGRALANYCGVTGTAKHN